MRRQPLWNLVTMNTIAHFYGSIILEHLSVS